MNRKQVLFLAAGASTALATQALAQSDLDSARAHHDQLLSESALHSSSLDGHDDAMNFSGQLQFRYLINSRDEVVPSTEEDTTIGFQVRRAKFGIDGDLTEELSYKIKGAFDRSGGTFELEDAYFAYDLGDGWGIRAGQFKRGLLREELVSSSRQLAVERSVVNETFNQGRSQGIELNYATEDWRVNFGTSDGLMTQNADFTSSAEADYAFNGRFEYKGAGEWDQFKDFTSWQGSEFAWMIGGAAWYQDGGETFGTIDVGIFEMTVDASFEGNGWNAYAAFVWQNVDPASSSSGDHFGVVAQGGYFFTPKLEAFGRYDGIYADDSIVMEDTFNSLTFGANYYLLDESHNAKFTGDVVIFLDQQAGSLTSASTGVPLLADTGDSQVSVRLQFQVLF